ncbi:hypothetical protein [Chryseobacterium koreense]|uniref:hypothetical protein n=1 Tax=Chryseobacterium koreense TaxID=232216 RepID=UPI0026E95B3F|nr:hypothetical protein [Chryseobacterium koreense]
MKTKNIFLKTMQFALLLALAFFTNCERDEPGTAESATTGNAIFWVASDIGCGSINVSLNGENGSITKFNSSGSPDCGTAGNANFTLPGGTYNFTANSTGGCNWSGSIKINNGVCSKMELTNNGGGNGGGGNGGGGNGGGGGSCNSMNASISTTYSWPKNCGNPDDLSITAKNNSGEILAIRIAIKKKNGTWDCGLKYGVGPNSTMTYWSCSATGEYRVYSMKQSDNDAGCKFPVCGS